MQRRERKGVKDQDHSQNLKLQSTIFVVVILSVLYCSIFVINFNSSNHKPSNFQWLSFLQVENLKA